MDQYCYNIGIKMELYIQIWRVGMWSFCFRCWLVEV